MDGTLILVSAIVLIALVFDYINGFHDAANSVATIVATRVLTPAQAVVWAAFFNFVAAFLFGTGVAKTIGSGMIDLQIVTPYVILGGLIGAIVWDLITWWFGLPTSSSHALIGGYAGAAMAKVGIMKGASHSFEAIVINGWKGWPETLAYLVFAPFLGLILAYFLMVAIYWMFRGFTPVRMDNYFRKLQLLSAAVFSCAHGSNDAQKTMGIITGVLVSGKFLKTFDIPLWVILASYAAIALGTLSGGWRIIRTMGGRLTRLKPRGGFCAETAAAISILFSTYTGTPVSTTHVIAGAIVGVGSIQRLKAVRWGLATTIVWAWVLTIPAAAGVGALSMFALRLFTENI
jgi:PiT family inorganic phosphate transporter